MAPLTAPHLAARGSGAPTLGHALKRQHMPDHGGITEDEESVLYRPYSITRRNFDRARRFCLRVRRLRGNSGECPQSAEPASIPEETSDNAYPPGPSPDADLCSRENRGREPKTTFAQAPCIPTRLEKFPRIGTRWILRRCALIWTLRPRRIRIPLLILLRVRFGGCAECALWRATGISLLRCHCDWIPWRAVLRRKPRRRPSQRSCVRFPLLCRPRQ